MQAAAAYNGGNGVSLPRCPPTQYNSKPNFVRSFVSSPTRTCKSATRVKAQCSSLTSHRSAAIALPTQLPLKVVKGIIEPGGDPHGE